MTREFTAASAFPRQRGWKPWVERREHIDYSTGISDAAQDRRSPTGSDTSSLDAMSSLDAAQESLHCNATEGNSSRKPYAPPVREPASTNSAGAGVALGGAVDSGAISMRLQVACGLAEEGSGGNWSQDASWRAIHVCGAGGPNPEIAAGDPFQARGLVSGESDGMGAHDAGRQAAVRERCMCHEGCAFPVLAVGRADE